MLFAHEMLVHSLLRVISHEKRSAHFTDFHFLGQLLLLRLPSSRRLKPDKRTTNLWTCWQEINNNKILQHCWIPMHAEHHSRLQHICLSILQWSKREERTFLLLFPASILCFFPFFVLFPPSSSQKTKSVFLAISDCPWSPSEEARLDLPLRAVNAPPWEFRRVS